MQISAQPMPLSPEVIDDRVAIVLQAGENVTLIYDDVANVLTISATPGGGGGTYTDEQAQDAVGNILADSATIDFLYNDTTPSISGFVKDVSITEPMLSLNDNTIQDSSAIRHGLLPKLSNNTTTFLRGDGTWIAPPMGTSYTDEQAQDAIGIMLLDTVTIDLTYNDVTPSLSADVKDASITEAKLLLADNTTQNASTIKHGLLPKLSGVITEFLNGTGVWSVPAGGMTNEQIQDIVGAMVVGSTSVAFTYNDTVGTINVSLQPGGVDESHINLSDNMLDDVSIFKHGFTPKLSGNSLHYLNGNGGWTTPTTTFLALTDTPDAYASNALKILRVNTGATAIEFGPVLGTMATQNADAVAITGGTAQFTGLIDTYYSLTAVNSIRAGGFATLNRAGDGIAVFYTDLAAAGGTGRHAISCNGDAHSYFAGNVGIGNATPSYPLDVTGSMRVTGTLGLGITPDAAVGLYTQYDKSTQWGLVLRPTVTDTGKETVIFQNIAGTFIGSITTTATATAYNTSSDVRLKHAVQNIADALYKIAALRPVTFKWNADDSQDEGFLAHELQQIIPHAVTGEPDAVNDDGTIRPQQVDHSKLVPWLVAGMQELLNRVTNLEAQVAALQSGA